MTRLTTKIIAILSITVLLAVWGITLADPLLQLLLGIFAPTAFALGMLNYLSFQENKDRI